MHKERFCVEFIIEGSVEVLLPPDATETQIDRAAKAAIYEMCRKGRGSLPGELQIGHYEGPY